MLVDKEKYFLRGDVDGDDAFTGLNDVLFLLSFQFTDGPAPPCLEAADADDNGTLNGLADALFLLWHQFLDGPPPPYPDCGAKVNPLTLGCESPSCP